MNVDEDIEGVYGRKTGEVQHLAMNTMCFSHNRKEQPRTPDVKDLATSKI
jgi:hypothetical protein